jgi:hypothetical protein
MKLLAQKTFMVFYKEICALWPLRPLVHVIPLKILMYITAKITLQATRYAKQIIFRYTL